jgi:hypothetical protein
MLGPAEADAGMTRGSAGQFLSEQSGGRFDLNGDVSRFERDEAGYSTWLRENPGGFVLNCEPNPSAAYVMLHRADCYYVTIKAKESDNWTTNYVKICAPKNGLLVKWSEVNVGRRPDSCGHCEPLSPGRR